MGSAKAVFVDTNVLIDVACAERVEHAAAREMFLRAARGGQCRFYALSSSLKDVYYVLCRHYARERDARDAVIGLATELGIVDLTKRMVLDGCLSDEPDVEDALVRIAAESVDARVIVSRDRRAFASSLIPQMTPREFLDAMGA